MTEIGCRIRDYPILSEHIEISNSGSSQLAETWGTCCIPVSIEFTGIEIFKYVG